jgi:nucleoside-diphosphate-sugar epimerase
MKIVVTGSNGFVGANLIEELQKRFPEAEIACLVRGAKKNSQGNIKYYPVNYLDKNTLLNSPAFDEIDYFYHVAGVTKSATEKGFIEGNVIPGKNILETIKEKKLSVKRFLLVSSQTACGPSKGEGHFKSEEETENPVELYGKSKLASEKNTIGFGDVIPYTIISPSSVYGPRDVDFFNIFKMTKSGVNLYAGNKFQTVSLIYVKDLVSAIINSSLSDNTVNKKYFVNDDEPKNWIEIQSAIFKICGRGKIDVTVPFGLLNVLGLFGSAYSKITGQAVLLNMNKIELSKPGYWVFSNQKAKNEFGFSCELPFEEAMKKTYEWYKANNWL